jgi:DNA-binding transcriptional MocR family regulator
MPLQKSIKGSDAGEIAASVEDAILRGRLAPGERLPVVRGLATRLRVSPGTVASAYRMLQARGLVTADGRRGTRVNARPPLTGRVATPVPANVRDLSGGGPDPALLPALGEALKRLSVRPRLYTGPYNDPELIEMAAAMFAADSIAPGPIAVVGGALDGIERVLNARLRVGDRVAVEDPGYFAVLDLLRALGLTAVPIAVDDFGLVPEEVERALAGGIEALIVTPRAQNPTGAALDAGRTRDLRRMLRAYPEALVIEDDHAGPIAGTPAFSLAEPERARRAVVRSVSKWLGPDLRAAFVTGDELTIGRVEGRQRLGTGWVSHILQQLVVAILADPRVAKLEQSAVAAYAARRGALIEALGQLGIRAAGRSGLNVWIPVPEESVVVQSLLEAGWAVAAGERFRIKSAPAVRISIATIRPGEAERFAAAFAGSFAPQRMIRSA